jgi:hypothetical protein
MRRFRQWMKASLACALLLLGCAAGSEELVPREPPLDHRRLQQLRSAHSELLARLAAAPAPHVESCSSTAGDCLIEVAEKRGGLVRSLRLNACEQADFPGKSGCITGQLESGGRTRELSDYLALENWCFARLTQCTADTAEQARQAARDARYAARKQELEAASEAQSALGAVLLTRARIEYLRATLPPDAAACPPESDRQACQAGVESARKALDQSLHQDEYDPAAATSSYAALERAEDGCARPELECLSAAMRSYGVVPEARKWVDRNLELLARRQELVTKVSVANAERCVAALQQQHQADIVSAYVAYVHEPVLFYRTQLDKAFLTLHQAQVSCLATRPQTSPAKQAVAVKR